MTYYQVSRMFLARGWVCAKTFNNQETWIKGTKIVVISMEDNIPKHRVESLMSA